MTLVVSIPLLGGVVVLFTGRRRPGIVGGAIAVGTLIACIQLARQIWVEGPQKHLIGGWAAPLGINLYADGLAGVLLLLTGATGMLISFYAARYFDCSPGKEWVEGDLFWPLWFFLWAGLNALFVSADIFNIYVVLELATLAAVALATLSGTSGALKASLRYLLAALAGSMAYLMGVALLYASYHTLDIYLLGEVVEGGIGTGLAVALMTFGLLVKTALFPVHFWLPPAHSAAPAPVSAILSALVVKGSFYVILRLWVEVFDASLTYAAGQMLGWLGAAGIVWGSFQAIRQQRLKMLIAHSTVGQVGYLFLLFPILTAGLHDAVVVSWAWSGGIYQAVAHGLAKASMFLAAGVLLRSTGSDNLMSMRELAGRLPITTFALALSGISLIGLPPSGGFVAKWLLMKSFIGSGQWWWVVVITLGGLLTTAYVFVMIRNPFRAATKPPVFRPVSKVLEVAALLLALVAILLGIRAEELMDLLNVGGPFPVPPVLEEVDP